MHMFCYQCQETGMERGCLYFGACGKSEETANYQDLLIHLLRGIAFCAGPGSPDRPADRETGQFICRALYATVTNTNFDPDRFVELIRQALDLRNRLREANRSRLPATLPDEAVWEAREEAALRQKSLSTDIRNLANPDLRSLRELAVYAMKGIGAYTVHAARTGFHHDAIYHFLHRSLAAMTGPQSEDELEELALETGRMMIAAMDLLDRAHLAAYGKPEITRIPLGTRKRPGILISGHELADLEELLLQTAGTGIDVYTHSEMWAAHQYPRFKEFPHLAGNYGNAWWMQDLEFASFNGPVLVTSNCIIPVAPAYRNRIFTTGTAGYPGLPHIPEAAPGRAKDFSPLITLAAVCPPPEPLDPEDAAVTAGFSHHAVVPLLPRVLDAIRAGKIKKFVVMGGCDGRDPRRDYYSRIARGLPPDAVILSAGCAKFRFIKMNSGTIEGLPRVLDAGQCNDCYSLVRIALALKEATGAASLDELPLALDIAWYDQKAVGVILALASLGVHGIRIGPTLPAFLQTEAGRRFMAKYDIIPIQSLEEDLAALRR